MGAQGLCKPLVGVRSSAGPPIFYYGDYMEFDTWLLEDDVLRLYKVCQGKLGDAYATDEELSEFSRVVMHAAMIKFGGEEYSQHIVQ